MLTSSVLSIAKKLMRAAVVAGVVSAMNQAAQAQPKFSAPKFSGPSLPSIPKPGLPSLPKPSAPSLPSIPKPVVRFPSLPKPTAPSIPSIPKPVVRVPKPTTPSIPSIPKPVVRIPSLPGLPGPIVRIPTLPGMPGPGIKVPPGGTNRPTNPTSNGQPLGTSVPGIPTTRPPKTTTNSTTTVFKGPVFVIPVGILGQLSPPPAVLNRFVPVESSGYIVPRIAETQPDPLPDTGTPVTSPPVETAKTEPAKTESESPEAGGNTTALQIDEIDAESPAEQAGLQAGDIVLALDGNRIKNHAQFRAIARSAVKAIRITYFNASKNRVDTRDIVPADGRLGLHMSEIRIDLDEEDENSDVVTSAALMALQVTEVTPRSLAARAGILVNDVIVAVDGRRVDSEEALAACLKAAKGEVELLYIGSDDGKPVSRKISPTGAELGVTVKRIGIAEK